MANTYYLIGSNVLSSTAASVAFSSIPSTYTDLLLRVSARTNRAATNSFVGIQPFNSDTGTNYSYTALRQDNAGTGTRTFGGDSLQYTAIGYANASTTTSNTFANFEFYIPSYTSSESKPVGVDYRMENNSTTGLESFVGYTAGLWQSSSAINGVTIFDLNGASFIAGSSFYLYGIKNS